MTAESTRARIREGLYPSHAGDVPHVTVDDGRWLLAEVDRLLAASSERSDPPKDDRTFGTDYPNLKGRCPACHNETLFRGSKGYITCSWLKCPNPGAVVDLLEETSAERLAVVPPVGPQDEELRSLWKVRARVHLRMLEYREQGLTTVADELLAILNHEDLPAVPPAGTSPQDALDAMNEWLSNSDGLMTEDVIDWRNQLAHALHTPNCSVLTDSTNWKAPCDCGRAGKGQ